MVHRAFEQVTALENRKEPSERCLPVKDMKHKKIILNQQDFGQAAGSSWVWFPPAQARYDADTLQNTRLLIEADR